MALVKEFLGHTRMSRLPVVAAAHWFVMVSFGLLFVSLVTAFGQLFSPSWALPVIGHFFLFEWAIEAIAWLSLLGILTLIAIRQAKHPRRSGRRSRFFGSTFWQAYYVEATILGVVVCVIMLRALEYALGRNVGASNATAFHYPLTAWLGAGLRRHRSRPDQDRHHRRRRGQDPDLDGLADHHLGAADDGRGLAPVPGVLQHLVQARVLGRTALGALRPMMIDGAPIDFENIEELDEDAALGVGKVEDFTWKGLLDFTTCTECGRCQDQCPAWNTEKPLSPKLLMMALRDHAHAKAPYLPAPRRRPAPSRG